MATAFKIDNAPTETAVAAVALATGSDPRTDLTFEQADGKDPINISDDEVIAWLGERGCVGPFTADFLDQMRSSIGGHRFVEMLRGLHRDHPERIPKLVAAYRSEPGLEEFGDAIERLFGKPVADRADVAADADPDTQIVAAWERRQQALAQIEKRGSFFHAEWHSSEATEVFDLAEMVIQNQPASTPRAILAKLWVALSHMGAAHDDEDRERFGHYRRADMAAIEPIAKGLDFDEASLFSAIQGMTRFVAQSDSTPEQL